MSTITLAYNPNDFFYTSSYNVPSDDLCSQFLKDDKMESNCSNCYNLNLPSNIQQTIDDRYNGIITNTSIGTNGNVFIDNCDLNYINENGKNCFEYQLCKNKDLAKSSNNLQNNYNAYDERYANIKKEYDYALLHTINIISGIIIITGLTYYYISE